MAEREAGNWLAAYLEYTKESESPESYHIWSGLSALASVARRNVFLDQNLYSLFPNLYVALVGPPARTAKSTAIWLSRQLSTIVPGLVMGPDACSREQLIRAMAESKFNGQCCLTIHSSEFSSIIDTSGILMIQFLTDIFDGNYTATGGWRYETKTSGKDQIIKPCLNMLVGTTPSYIADSMPDNVTGHGFTSRTIWVYGDKERHQNPLPDFMNSPMGQALAKDLVHIASIFGEFHWDCDKFGHDHQVHRGINGCPEDKLDCGSGTYKRFYHNLYKTIPDDHRIEGYHWRKKIHTLKVAMLLSLAERDELVLDAPVIDTAIKFLDAIEGPMARTFSAVGKYDHASDLERIGSQIVEANGMAVSDVFSRNYFVGDERQLRSIIQSLGSMGIAKLELREGKEWLTPTKGKKLPWKR